MLIHLLVQAPGLGDPRFLFVQNNLSKTGDGMLAVILSYNSTSILI